MKQELDIPINPMADIASTGDPMIKKTVRIGGRSYQIVGDNGYLSQIGDVFETTTINTLRVLCDNGAHALDVGANIGLTTLALSQYCKKVVGVEPVPLTFNYLLCNTINQPNISLCKHALGSAEGIICMQGYIDFLAGSFIANTYNIPHDNHFSEEVPIKRLDNCFSSMGLDRLDFIKVDVEGFEIEVFEGGRQVLGDFKPMVFMEMNHWCLNVFHRISIPEFRERLLTIFPYVYAIDGENYLDYGDEKNVHYINHSHVIEHRFSNLVAGFDRNQIIERLELLPKPAVASTPAPLGIKLDIELALTREKLAEAQRELEAFKRSTSWRITAPLRTIWLIFRH